MVMNRGIIFRGILLISFIITILSPFCGDLFASFGGAFQADYLGSFPQNVYSSWNIRGIGYKIILFLFYKLFAFVGLDSSLFPVIIRTFYYLFFLSLTYLFVYLIKKPLSNFNINYKNVFYIFCIGILTTSPYIHLQPEELSLFFCVGMIAFSLADNKYLNLLAGAFIPILLSFKLVTVLYAGFPALIVFLLYYNNSDKRKIFAFIISCMIFSVLTFIFYYFIIPQEITDTVNATYFQDSFHFTIATPYRFVLNFIGKISHIPIILIGIFLLVNLLKHYKWDIKKLLMLILLFLPPTLSIIVQGKFFYYHYAVFIIVTSILYGMLSSLKVEIKNNVIYYSLFVIFLFYTFVPGKIRTIKDNEANIFYWYNIKDLLSNFGSTLRSKYSKQQDVLFLTDGQINYFYREKSYLRYFAPLPVQRSGFKLKNQGVYKETISKILTYNGDVILLQPQWFTTLVEYPLIINKIKTEYILNYEYKTDKQNIGYEVYIKRK